MAKLLLCLATLVTFLSVVNCDLEEKKTFDVSGAWINVKVYPNLPKNFGNLKLYCKPHTLKQNKGYCDCGKHTKVPVFQITLGGNTTRKANIPVLVFNAEEENNVQEALSYRCSCPNNVVRTDAIFVVRYLNDNYVLGNTRLTGSNVTVLYAKEMPSEDDLKNLEQTSNILKDKEGEIVCKKDNKSGTIVAVN